MKYSVLLFFGFFLVHAQAQVDPSKALDSAFNSLNRNTFKELLEENQLEFTMPKGFKKVKVKKNDNVFYQYAIKDKKSGFEIRIFIRPYGKLMEDTTKFNPNLYTYNMLAVMALNASGNLINKIPQIDLFPKEGAKKEFNADWGATTAFSPNTSFGEGFNFCALNCLRKDDVGEVYIYYLFTDVQNQQQLLLDGMYILKFKW